jgi:hypothetical protein
MELYPFLIAMDDYKAVISGRYTTENRINYHVSVTDTPLPVRLGLDITGTHGLDRNYKLVPCKYKHLYNPKKQGAVRRADFTSEKADFRIAEGKCKTR